MKEHKQFKPYDRVLVKDSGDVWQIDFYSHWNDEYKLHITLAYGDGLRIEDSHILPFEGNEHLLGTDQEPAEEVGLKAGEFIIVADFISQFSDGLCCIRKFGGGTNPKFFFDSHANFWEYAVRFSDFNPDDMEETKKHILCVRDGKVVRYHNK